MVRSIPQVHKPNRKPGKVVKLDLSYGVTNEVIDVKEFKTFVESKLKEVTSGAATVTLEGAVVLVKSDAGVTKRSLKYFAKKYLGRAQMTDILRFVASKKDTYILRTK